jgi:hypothetical protein
MYDFVGELNVIMMTGGCKIYGKISSKETSTTEVLCGEI